MTTRLERREPGATTTGRSSSNLRGTWTIDPAHSSIAFTWRALRLWTVTGRRHCLGVIHLDELPPIGVIRFQQRSGLLVLTMALDPASLETRDPDLNAMLSGPDFGAVRRQRWWTLHSQSLEVLPSGAWRVMAALIAHGSQGLVELRLEIDPEQSRSDWLVLRGWGVLDRRAFGIGRGAWCFDPAIQLELAVQARRVEAVRGRVSSMSAPKRNRRWIPEWHRWAAAGLPDRSSGRQWNRDSCDRAEGSAKHRKDES